MTTRTWPIAGVPVTRAERYPHDIGPDADPDAGAEAIGVTRLTVNSGHVAVGRVTLTAFADHNDAWGFDFDLEPADARDLAKLLIEAGADGERAIATGAANGVERD